MPTCIFDSIKKFVNKVNDCLSKTNSFLIGELSAKKQLDANHYFNKSLY